MESAHAEHIKIVNTSSQKINELEMLSLAHKYQDLVLKYWNVPKYPITIYFADDWEESAKASIKENYIAYHWYRDEPFIFINMSNVRFYKKNLTVVLTHELGEATVNPFVDQYVIYKNRTVYLEITDPTSTTFTLGRYKVADFALPSFYDIKAKGPYSYKKSLKRPFKTNTGFEYIP